MARRNLAAHASGGLDRRVAEPVGQVPRDGSDRADLPDRAALIARAAMRATVITATEDESVTAMVKRLIEH